MEAEAKKRRINPFPVLALLAIIALLAPRSKK
jgi:hypothetical protein